MDLTTPLLIETKELKDAAMCFRALNHKLRQKILQLVHKKGKITVTNIYRKLAIEQSVTSQHLAVLRRQGIVTTTRQGKFIFYTVNYMRIKELEAFAGQLLDITEQGNVLPLKHLPQIRLSYEQPGALLLAVKNALEKM